MQATISKRVFLDFYIQDLLFGSGSILKNPEKGSHISHHLAECDLPFDSFKRLLKDLKVGLSDVEADELFCFCDKDEVYTYLYCKADPFDACI
jgi:hypothetical protein